MTSYHLDVTPLTTTLGPAIQSAFHPAKSTPIQVMSNQFVQQNAVEFKAHQCTSQRKKKKKKAYILKKKCILGHKFNFRQKKHDSRIKPPKYKSLAIPNNTIHISLSDLCIAGYIAEHTNCAMIPNSHC